MSKTKQLNFICNGDLYLKQGVQFSYEAVIQRAPVYSLLITVTIKLYVWKYLEILLTTGFKILEYYI